MGCCSIWINIALVMQAENCNSARLRLALLQFLSALLAQLILNTTATHPITYTYSTSAHIQVQLYYLNNLL